MIVLEILFWVLAIYVGLYALIIPAFIWGRITGDWRLIYYWERMMGGPREKKVSKK